MTNAEKHISWLDKFKAWNEWKEKIKCEEKCKVMGDYFCAGCAIKWLDMEADEEKKNGKKNIKRTMRRKLQCKTDDKIRSKLLEIVYSHDYFANTIEFYSFAADNKTLKVVYKYSFQGHLDWDEYVIPVKWLDLNISELKIIIEAEKEEAKKKRIEEEKKELERKELQEYERLKTKFEKEK